MELRDYLRILRKRWWIIVLVTLLTAAAALGFSTLLTPVYEASVQLSVWPDRIDNGAQLAAKALLRGFARFADSNDFAARVIQDLQLDMDPQTLNDKVTITSIDEDFIIQIDVRDTSGPQAMRIANTWADQFVEWRNVANNDQRKEDRVSARMNARAERYDLFSPKKTLNTAAGGIIGLTLGGLIVFVLEWIESGVLRTPEDVERAMGMTVLGAIPTGESKSRRARAEA